MNAESHDATPRKGFHPTDLHKRQFGKNMAVLAALVAFGLLLFAVGLVKMQGL